VSYGQNRDAKAVNRQLLVGAIGDYDPQRLSHLATVGALRHAAQALAVPVEVHWLATPTLEGEDSKILAQYGALWCAPGSPYASTEGALSAIRYARERGVPFLGT
jgi:CTP synthase (UTP-ammonia lyase)